MRDVTITVYGYGELSDSAKQKARYTIELQLYENESDDWSWAKRKFDELLSPHCFINYEDLRFLIDKHIGHWLLLDFIENYKYHGLRDVHYVKKAFREFADNEWSNFFFEECDVAEYCEGNEIEFFIDGTIYQE